MYNELHPRSLYATSNFTNIISKYGNMHEIDYFIGLGIWSDGCNISQMTNRVSVKSITIHIIHHKVTIDHVFPIGLGIAKMINIKIYLIYF